MNTSDLTMLSKIAIGLAIAGFFVSFTVYSYTSSSCEFMDYGKVVLGGLALMIGGLGEVSALRLSEGRMVNLLASGGASVVGIFHLLMGFGIIGGPC